MNNPTIAFIGAGNMARSLIGGIIADGGDPERLRVADPSLEQLNALREQWGPMFSTHDNRQAVHDADVVVLAVKPHHVRTVAREVADDLRLAQPLIVSIAAGIRTRDLDIWLGGDVPIVRAMPNTPALVRSGATGLYATANVDASRREVAEKLLRSVGLTLWVEREDLLNIVTAVSGSGPAYFFLVMEAIESAAIDQGLPQETARLLTLETALGSAKLALESDEEPAALRRRVTSRGGTTERALEELEPVAAAFHAAIRRATERARELEREQGESRA